MSDKVSLVDFQRAIFAQIAAFEERGDERLCLRFLSGINHWAMDAGDIAHVAQLPRNISTIPASPPFIKGLIQENNEVYTIFDLSHILTGSPTVLNKHNRVLMLHHDIMQGVALLVDKTYSLIPIDNFHVDENKPELAFAQHSLKIKKIDTPWYWINLIELLSSNQFAAVRKVDIQAK